MAWLIDRLPLLSALQDLYTAAERGGQSEAAAAFFTVGGHVARLGAAGKYYLDRDDLARYLGLLAALNDDRGGYLAGLYIVARLAGLEHWGQR